MRARPAWGAPELHPNPGRAPYSSSPGSLRSLPPFETAFDAGGLFDTPALLRAGAGGVGGSAGGAPPSPCPFSNDAFLRTVAALTGDGPSPSSPAGGSLCTPAGPGARARGAPPPCAPRFTPAAALPDGRPPVAPFPKLTGLCTPGGQPGFGGGAAFSVFDATPPPSAGAASCRTGLGAALFRDASLPSGTTPATVASWRAAPAPRAARRPSAGTVGPRAAAAAGAGGPPGAAWPGKGSSKYRGVSWHKDNLKWRATIFKGQKPVHIGYYANAEDAARAYDVEAVKLRGPRTVLNFPAQGGVGGAVAATPAGAGVRGGRAAGSRSGARAPKWGAGVAAGAVAAPRRGAHAPRRRARAAAAAAAAAAV